MRFARNEGTAMFRKEWRAGLAFYWPVNALASECCILAGMAALSEERLASVRRLGFTVEDAGSGPLANPRAS